jgi:hypothetical protein
MGVKIIIIKKKKKHIYVKATRCHDRGAYLDPLTLSRMEDGS